MEAVSHPTDSSGPAAVEAAAAPARPLDGEQRRREALALLASIFFVAACGLVYELLIATVSSYLMGNSVTQFSVSIGLFVGSMGVGSWLSQRVRRRLLGTFVALEVLLGVLGGAAAPALHWAYGAGDALPWYPVALYGFLVTIGTLVGVELPLLVRLLNGYGELRTIVAQALSVDYLGCLLGSLAFPLILLPALGQMQTGFLVGLLNVGVALYTLGQFRERFRGPVPVLCCAAAALLLGLGFMNALRLSLFLERQHYDDQVIWAKQSAYQRIVFTRWRDDFRLFLDGNLQFSSVDEYRYHETLVHPALSLSATPRDVLVLGGGDGLGIREVLRHPGVSRVTVVDLDPEITRMARTLPALKKLNGGALQDARVQVVNEDAHRFLERTAQRFSVIIADLPDPNGDALAKLYSVQFYRLIRRHLARGGVFATQATSPFFSREAFWCVVRTMRAAGLHVRPYHAYVPSFGDWGFALGAERPLDLRQVTLPAGLRYLTPELTPALQVFEGDAGEAAVEVSTVDHPRILRYYLEESRKWE